MAQKSIAERLLSAYRQTEDITDREDRDLIIPEEEDIIDDPLENIVYNEKKREQEELERLLAEKDRLSAEAQAEIEKDAWVDPATEVNINATVVTDGSVEETEVIIDEEDQRKLNDDVLEEIDNEISSLEHSDIEQPTEKEYIYQPIIANDGDYPIGNNVENVDNNVDTMETLSQEDEKEIENIEETLEHTKDEIREEIDKNFEHIKEQQDSFEKEMEEVEKQIEENENKFEVIEQKDDDIDNIDEMEIIETTEDEVSDVPKNQTELEQIAQIIKISRLYLGYDDELRNFVNKILNIEVPILGNSEDLNDQAVQGTYAILTTPNSDRRGVSDLLSLHLDNRPTRAFNLMKLDTKRLLKVLQYVMLFNENMIKPETKDKIEFCRALEQGIEDMDGSIFAYLSYVDELFKI